MCMSSKYVFARLNSYVNSIMVYSVNSKNEMRNFPKVVNDHYFIHFYFQAKTMHIPWVLTLHIV